MKRSFALKDAAYDIISHVAFIIGGYSHMLEVNDEMKDMAIVETTKDYFAEFRGVQSNA